MAGNYAHLDPIEGEVWKTIKDFGDYEVSDRGRVRSYKQLIRGHGRTKIELVRDDIERNGVTAVTGWMKPHLMTGSNNTKFYERDKLGNRTIQLCGDGRHETHSIARIVYEAFVGPVLDGHVVCHHVGTEDDTPGNLYTKPDQRASASKSKDKPLAMVA